LFLAISLFSAVQALSLGFLIPAISCDHGDWPASPATPSTPPRFITIHPNSSRAHPDLIPVGINPSIPIDPDAIAIHPSV
jgi:hypothetical protein